MQSGATASLTVTSGVAARLGQVLNNLDNVITSLQSIEEPGARHGD